MERKKGRKGGKRNEEEGKWREIERNSGTIHSFHKRGKNFLVLTPI
jgi:hypothetical protein